MRGLLAFLTKLRNFLFPQQTQRYGPTMYTSPNVSRMVSGKEIRCRLGNRTWSSSRLQVLQHRLTRTLLRSAGSDCSFTCESCACESCASSDARSGMEGSICCMSCVLVPNQTIRTTSSMPLLSLIIASEPHNFQSKPPRLR